MALVHESARQQHLPAEKLTLRIEATNLRTSDDVIQVQLRSAVMLVSAHLELAFGDVLFLCTVQLATFDEGVV